jgi:hyperosmotically inducible protein
MMRATRILASVTATALLLPALAFGQVEEALDNAALQTKVKAKLMTEAPIKATAVNLETENGVVQLGGFVDDEMKGKKAAEIVAGMEGVRKVDNQLHAKPGDRDAGQAVDDGLLTTKLKGGLAEADLGTAAGINIDTYNGVVLLTGFVDTAETKRLAEKYVAEHEGVARVINGIYVRD